MARYIQRIALLGKERWIGWEIDGVGTEIPGLTLADDMSEAELAARGIREFRPMRFEQFLGLGAVATAPQPQENELHERDIEYRLDALLVAMERLRSRGISDVSRAVLLGYFGDERHLAHPSVQERLRQWQEAGQIAIIGAEECYLRIVGRLT